MRFALVTSCTCLNLVLGLLAIYFAAESQFTFASVCLIISVCFDACDGYLARKWDVASEFGAQLDSLGDLTSFCTATGFFTFYWLNPHLPSHIMAIPAALYVCLGAMRLARYNANTDSMCPPKYFEGLPTTAACCILACLYLASPNMNPYLGMFLTLSLGLLMFSKVPYPKLTKITNVPIYLWLLPFVFLFVHFSGTIWLCCSLYAISGPIVYLRSKKAN